jgi:hypothetical protein
MNRFFVFIAVIICVASALALTQSSAPVPIDWKGSVRIVENIHREGKHAEDNRVTVTDSSTLEINCSFDPSTKVDGVCSYNYTGITMSSKGRAESTVSASDATVHVKAGFSNGKVGIGIAGFEANWKLSTDLGGGTEKTTVGPFSYEAPASSPSGSWSNGQGRTISWSLTPIYAAKSPAGEGESEDKPEEVEAAFKADEYESWIPKAGDDEEQPGNTVMIHARVHKKDKPDEQSPKKARFRFELVSVSQEKGVCLNWPQPKDQKGGYDLKFDPAGNPDLEVAKDGLSATSKELSYSATAVVTSYDWGGWGTVMVTAYPENSGTLSAHLENDKSKHDLSIPKDENNNHIADSWEDANVEGIAQADADDDMLPAGDGHQGDGFPTYEEYRGFRAKGSHIQTNPFQKDLFVWDPTNLGLGYFNQSGITVHLVGAYEWDLQSSDTNPRVINFNRGNASIGAQHLLYLKNENMPGLYGLADGTGPGAPKTCKVVKIDVARCRNKNEQELKSTIAHELSHACNAWHHGQNNYEIAEWEELQPAGSWVGFRYKDGTKLVVAAQGGQESGAETCIMRYDGESLYENPNGPFRWKKPGGSVQRGDRYPPVELAGTMFCDKPDGTGVNAPGGYHGVSKAGNASKGDCKHQLCVNDMRH